MKSRNSEKTQIPSCFHRAFQSAVVLAIVLQTNAFSADEEGIELAILPKAERKDLTTVPKNLARWHMGSNLMIENGTGGYTTISYQDKNLRRHKESALLGDDETLGFLMPEGEKEMIIDLGQQYVINHFLFRDFSARGTCHISASTQNHAKDSKEWRDLGEISNYEPESVLSIDFPMTEAQFIRLSFNTIKEGEIGTFGIYGDVKVADAEFNRLEDGYNYDQTLKEELVNYDYASLYSGSSISHLSSGDLQSANNMIDDDIYTYYDFSPEDEYSLLILDLSTRSKFNTVSINLLAEPGVLDFYYFTDPPETYLQTKDSKETPLKVSQQSKSNKFDPTRASGVLTVSKEFFEEHSPIHSYKVENSEERIRFNFDDIENRYLLVRWSPAAKQTNPLRIFEISVLGDMMPEDTLLALSTFQFSETPATGNDAVIPPPSSPPQAPPVSP